MEEPPRPTRRRRRGSTDGEDMPRPSPYSPYGFESHSSVPNAATASLKFNAGRIVPTSQVRPLPDSPSQTDSGSSPAGTLQDAISDTLSPEDAGFTRTTSSSPQNVAGGSSPPDMPPTSAGTVLSLSDGDIHLVDLQKLPPIATGGFCEVHVAFHIPSKIKLAMKRPRNFPSDDVIRRFRREAATWSALAHVNILPFFGTMEIERHLYLVSPWMPLGDLLAFIQKHEQHITEGRLTERFADESLHPFHSSFREFNTIREIASGIEFLHSRGIVHGDIKAKNVLLSDDGCAKICDFGLTKATFHDVTSTELKGVGSIRWQSPELLRNASKSLESDIYAFGMTIVEVLTANYPLPNLKQYAFVTAVIVDDERPNMWPISRLGAPFGSLWSLASECWVADALRRPHIQNVLLKLDAIPIWLRIRSSEAVPPPKEPPTIGGGFYDLFTSLYRPTRLKLAMKRLKPIYQTSAVIEALANLVNEWSKFNHTNILSSFGMMDVGVSSEVSELASGIEYLHSVGFVHGNIKARNALLSTDGVVKICDHGFAETNHHAFIPIDAVAHPSLRWQAPELLLCEPKTLQSDVYAFAMTIVEILTGNSPLPYLDDRTFKERILQFNHRPPLYPMWRLDVDFNPLWQLASQCWSKNPSERPSMKEVVGQLDLGMAGHGVNLGADDSNLIYLCEDLPVASGTIHDVYLGFHGPRNLKLAMKRLRGGRGCGLLCMDFMATVQWRELKHVNILPFFGTFVVGTNTHLVCQWMELGNLLGFVGDRLWYIGKGMLGKPSPHPFYPSFKETRTIYEIAAGMEYLHALGVVHGTICAGNILLDDYGCAKIGSIDSADRRDSCPDCLPSDGHLRWKSPELLRGEPRSQPSDVYAFAMTIVETLTGTWPLPLIQDADFSNEVLDNNLRPVFQPASCLSVDFGRLWVLAARCWRANPSERPSMREVKGILKKLDSADFRNCVKKGIASVQGNR